MDGSATTEELTTNVIEKREDVGGMCRENRVSINNDRFDDGIIEPRPRCTKTNFHLAN